MSVPKRYNLPRHSKGTPLNRHRHLFAALGIAYTFAFGIGLYYLPSMQNFKKFCERNLAKESEETIERRLSAGPFPKQTAAAMLRDSIEKERLTLPYK